MTNEEKDLLISYLVDAGDIDPEGDVEAQFLDWYRIREGVVSGETHYKAILEAARDRKRSFEEGRPTGDRPGPPPLYGPCPSGWGSTPAVPATSSW